MSNKSLLPVTSVIKLNYHEYSQIKHEMLNQTMLLHYDCSFVRFIGVLKQGCVLLDFGSAVTRRFYYYFIIKGDHVFERFNSVLLIYIFFIKQNLFL